MASDAIAVLTEFLKIEKEETEMKFEMPGSGTPLRRLRFPFRHCQGYVLRRHGAYGI